MNQNSNKMELDWIKSTAPLNENIEDYLWYQSWPKDIRKHLTYPNKSLHELFTESVKRNSDLPYLSILGIDYSYNQINDMSNRFANALKLKGYGIGDHIAIFMPNLPQFVFVFFGILKIGATVVPISPLLGKKELTKIFKDSKISALVGLDILYPNLEPILSEISGLKDVIFTSLGDLISPVLRIVAKLIRKIPPTPKIKIKYEKLYSLIKNSSNHPISTKIDPKETIAVIGYTGGTTGIPKGAMLTHQNLVSNLHQGREWARIAHPIGIHKRFVGAVPFFHIIGLNAVMLVAMFYDSTIYLFPDPRKFESILQGIEKNKINYFHGVPTLHQAILNHPKFAKYDLSSLEMIFSGAAPLPKELGERLEKETRAMVIEAYGMTETSPMVAANPFEENNHRFGSIGIPFPDTEFKIFNENGDLELDVGKIGEIAIKGPQVMKGYWNNPSETAKTLRNGYIFTGDMGYLDKTGFLYIVDRKKDMIIASGYKIFPSELEQLVIQNFPEFKEAVITGTPDEYRGETVKLIAILRENVSISKERIINFFKENVAVYKIPKIIEFRSELPKTALGKVNRRKIRTQEFKTQVS
ncbi:AMP-binding protein [Promethearchaeum syntrophicum]|uniref:AMP-binding protein n=1 Tax=Promethearchaeum syntrophicum TaxID=2594042 RepID=A0A5B9DEB1_9ARCH|nr:AMP-binding protein [Candidatus Prometheoarchaeum syntrophicum]QEE17432.1 Acetyl-coenzyme A synthetase [Candidatus Prometheoarchaeum syntrophicum]